MTRKKIYTAITQIIISNILCLTLIGCTSTSTDSPDSSFEALEEADTQATDDATVSSSAHTVDSVSEDQSDTSEKTDTTDSSELTQEQKDFIHYTERLAAAQPYENMIMEEYLDDYSINDRVVGHIRLDGTDIDCPVLQKLEDYEFYLTHDIYDNDSEQGCIILDPDSEIGIGTKQSGYLAGYEPSTNQLVHGHNMRSGTMFGCLDNYASAEYGNNHPYIYFDSLYEKRTYKLVTAFYSQIYPEDSDEFKYYNFNNASSEEDFNEWYENIMSISLYRTDVPVEYGDEMITLSTCAYQTTDGRFAVVAKRIQ